MNVIQNITFLVNTDIIKRLYCKISVIFQIGDIVIGRFFHFIFIVGNIDII